MKTKTTTLDIIIQIFIEVDDRLGHQPKHPQAKLYASELVTIGILLALKGVSFRAFYRWLSRDYDDLFAGLPELAQTSEYPSGSSQQATVRTKLFPGDRFVPHRTAVSL